MISGVSYGWMINTFSTTGATTHSQLVTGLVNGGNYNYYVRCNDTSGNFNTNDSTISFSVASIINHNYVIKSCYNGSNANNICSTETDCPSGICLEPVVAWWSLDEGGDTTRIAGGICGDAGSDCDLGNQGSVEKNTTIYKEGSASATGTNYCKLRDYADLTSGRCEGINNCKDANTGDCTSYADSTAATCGTCCYATGACSSCTNYGSGTQGPTADYYFTEGSASATGTNYCKLRDYADLTSSRCEGLGDCKDANTGDCTGYGDSYVATCGTCCYATGACSSCTNYGAGTQGPTGDYYWASGQTCYYRDYHCTGSSCGETYGDSYQTSCSGCQYLAGCSGGSAGYCANYGYGTNCGGSNICDGYGNCIATYCGDTHPCGVAGTNYYRYYGPGGGCGGPNGCQGTQVIGPCEDCPCAAC